MISPRPREYDQEPHPMTARNHRMRSTLPGNLKRESITFGLTEQRPRCLAVYIRSSRNRVARAYDSFLNHLENLTVPTHRDN